MKQVTIKVDGSVYSRVNGSTKEIAIKYASMYIKQALEDCEKTVKIEIKDV